MTYVSGISKQWLRTNMFYMFLAVFVCVVIPMNPFCIPVLIVVVVTNLVFVLKFMKSVYWDMKKTKPLKNSVLKLIMKNVINKVYTVLNSRTGEEYVLTLVVNKDTTEQLFSLQNVTMDTFDKGTFTILRNGSIKLFGKHNNYKYFFNIVLDNTNVIKPKKDTQLIQYILADKKKINCHEKYSVASFKYINCVIQNTINSVLNNVTSIFDFIEQLFQTILNFFRPNKQDVLRRTYLRIIDIKDISKDSIVYTGLPSSYNYTSTTPSVVDEAVKKLIEHTPNK